MNLKRISAEFSVCKLSGPAEIGTLDITSGFWFLGKTDEELSLVCETSSVPQNAAEREDGFLAFRIEGILDFSLIGILSKISRYWQIMESEYLQYPHLTRITFL